MSNRYMPLVMRQAARAAIVEGWYSIIADNISGVILGAPPVMTATDAATGQ
ncbi:MAG: hypothetical protein NUV48_14110 [Peptococcaceae bacterium]|nr:hypothetical protein [Peptococcaceae bacterium]